MYNVPSLAAFLGRAISAKPTAVSVHVKRDGFDSVLQTLESTGGQTFCCPMLLSASLRNNETDAIPGTLLGGNATVARYNVRRKYWLLRLPRIEFHRERLSAVPRTWCQAQQDMLSFLKHEPPKLWATLDVLLVAPLIPLSPPSLVRGSTICFF